MGEELLYGLGAEGEVDWVDEHPHELWAVVAEESVGPGGMMMGHDAQKKDLVLMQ